MVGGLKLGSQKHFQEVMGIIFRSFWPMPGLRWNVLTVTRLSRDRLAEVLYWANILLWVSADRFISMGQNTEVSLHE
jgi:hypothetical protein